MKIGLDIGSTTLKLVVQEEGAILFSRYERHYSEIAAKAAEFLKEVRDRL